MAKKHRNKLVRRLYKESDDKVEDQSGSDLNKEAIKFARDAKKTGHRGITLICGHCKTETWLWVNPGHDNIYTDDFKKYYRCDACRGRKSYKEYLKSVNIKPWW